MDTKRDVLLEVKRGDMQTKLYYNLDNEIIEDIKSALIEKKEAIIDISVEDIERLNKVCTEIETLKKELPTENINYIKSLVYEVYLVYSIYKSMVDVNYKEMCQKFDIDEDSFKRVSEDKFIAINSITDVIKNNEKSLELIHSLKLNMHSLNRVLETSPMSINFFGIENISDKDSRLFQIKINDVISWRGPKYRVHLYTKNRNLLTYNTTSNFMLQYGHDYATVTYEKESSNLKKELK